MPPTGFVYHSACVEHDPGNGHPERPDRLRAVLARIESSGLADELDRHTPRAASPEELTLVHPESHVERVRAAVAASEPSRPAAIDGDTSVSPASWQAATRAAGGLIEACERVLEGSWDNAFCAVRPPGHHAEVDRAMGFCLFNNVAIAAEHLRRRHGLERIAILDWDVHHGNGTQHVFEDDPGVFYASLHQWPLYPGTGSARERGRGSGEGATLNCPMDPGTTDADWLRALEEAVLPALEDFAPEFVIVSAGFDAHAHDPLAGVALSEQGFAELTRSVLDFCRRVADARLVSALEGGYHLDALAASVEAHLGVLVGGPG